MQRVVDACVVAKWFLPEAHKEQAENLLHDFVDEKVTLMAPDILVIEIGSLLWKRSTRIKDISPANGTPASSSQQTKR
jgi:predicted nucleic acid-binding protein